MLTKKLLRKIRNQFLTNRIACCRSISHDTSHVQINIFGYFDYIFSISSNARDFVDVACLSAVDASLVPLRLGHKSICADRPLLDYYSMPSESANLNLWFVSFDSIEDCYRRNRKWFNGRYNTAVFWWEFEDYFTNVRCFEYLDEVVVFSSITYKALQKVVPDRVKLTKLEYPLIIYQPILSREDVFVQYELNSGKFCVLFVFDIHSCIERKNPHSVVKAFQLSWQKSSNLHLVLKISNFDLGRSDCQEFLSYIKSLGIQDNMTIVSDNLTEERMRELIGACDVYISLHRAEGLGLGMLEAMSMGKPVIATRFGGNLDFMNDDNSLLVDYSIVEVQKSFATYQKGFKWAEPDIEMAAKYLLSLSQDKNLYNKISFCAKESIARQYDRVKLQQSYLSFFKEHDAS